MADKKPVYDESKITTLNALDHIRLRPGMYIGRLGNGTNQHDGIYILLKEIVDNGIDEFIMGHGSKLEIKVEEDIFTARDYGRGIPLGKLIDCVSKMNTGAKYNSDVFQFSVGLNGVGTKAVNALSSYFKIRSIREGKYKEVYFEEGLLKSEDDGVCDEVNGTYVEFRPSREIFPQKLKIDMSFLKKRMANYSYLNRGLTLIFNGEKFYSRHGLLDLIKHEVDEEKLYDIIYFRDESLEFGFVHTTDYGESYSSYVNGQHTNDGGTHQSAFREGILKGVNEYSGKNYDGRDVREGVFGAIAVKVMEPVFESQTKNKLANTEIRTDIVNKIKVFIADFLHKNKSTADRIIDKITINERMRKNIQDIKKGAKDKAKKAALKIPKLKDCKHHFSDKNSSVGEDSMIFLTEGDSATGSMVSCRNVMTQALFSLRGKPLNVHGGKQEMMYKNEELYYIMRALDIEDNLETLRYNKVIIATDADQDGLHIRNLLLTYFLTYFENLVANGHLYILETPIFRVRTKKETIYCYDDDEKDAAMEKLGRGTEITRFKGLGEISPKEFGQFIGKDIRLIDVIIDKKSEIPDLLEFFMGKNTPKRKNFIMDNLI
ncbi:MAG: type IIA DNA topoisomerase subunit B [Lentisphaeraceae bacterium]|nr:type IIA DNA topoisomerase subunit B [Lentisphaeraceae bacterium]